MSLKFEVGIDEFVCPEQLGTRFPYVTTEYCESVCMNKGCSKLSVCTQYNKMKEIERNCRRM